MNLVYNGMPASHLPVTAWRKSRYSNPSGNCVEMAELAAGGVAVRNSRDPNGPALIFTPAEWHAFVGGVIDGDFASMESDHQAARKPRALTVPERRRADHCGPATR
jgi:hypothetical protein